VPQPVEAELLYVLMLPDRERPRGSASSGSYPQSRAIAKRLIGREEDRTLGAVLVSTLREA
jgi:hypothetical protein